MASFVKHIPCPKCGSKDNLAVYSDGSMWCFGCHYLKRPDLDKMEFGCKPKKQPSYINVTLPEDSSYFLFRPAKEWLDKYELTTQQYNTLEPLYSPSKELLIFPVYDADRELLMYQGRYFGDNPNHPKYLTTGPKDVLHIIDFTNDPDATTVIAVEDVISALKVAEVAPAIPLWGSGMPLKLARKLSERFSNLTLWLDMDKAAESLKMRSKLSMMFDKVDSIVTPKDPKEYNYDEIRGFIG